MIFFAAIEGLKSQILVEKFTKSSFSEVLMLDSQRAKFLSFSEVILLNFNGSWIINWFFLLWGLCPFLISQENKILRNNKLSKGITWKMIRSENNSIRSCNVHYRSSRKGYYKCKGEGRDII